MNRDQMKGIIDEMAGCAKRKAGELSDNPEVHLDAHVKLGLNNSTADAARNKCN